MTSISEFSPAQVVAEVERCGGIRAAVRLHGWHYSSAQVKYHKGLRDLEQQGKPYDFAQHISPADPVYAPELPDELLPVGELVERRKRQFEQKRSAKEARKLIPVHVRIEGPFGIAHFGDPHVDDDGTDLSLIERHAAAIRNTEGMLAGTVGDLSNNWVGRLVRLYAEQSTSRAEEAQLVEWFLGLVRWAYVVFGNHDGWNDGVRVLRGLIGQGAAIAEVGGARLALLPPGGREIRVNARHDFKGHSMWNTAHGPAKAAQMGWRDHILTCGHTHVSGYQVLKDPATGLISHALRVASYKTYDRYADEMGLPDQNVFVCPVTVIDPQYPDDDPRCIATIFDPEEGAEFLRWKRAKWKAGRRVTA